MSVARWPERGKGRGLGGSPRPHVLGHAANGPPDMRLVSVYTAGSSPNRAGEFWFPFNAPLPRWTAANQGARIVAVPHDATASPKKKPVPTACPPLNVAVTVPVPPAARLRLDALSEKKPPAVGSLIVRLRAQVAAGPRFSKVTSTEAPTGFPPVNPPKLIDAGLKRIAAPTDDWTLIRPPPRAIGPRPLVPVTVRSAKSTRADLTSSGDHVGWAARRSATAPVVRGVAIDVPWKNANWPPRML